MRRSFRLRVYGYVVMPEHIHLLVGEPAIESNREGHEFTRANMRENEYAL